MKSAAGPETAERLRILDEGLLAERDLREALAVQIAGLATTTPETAERLELLTQGLRNEREKHELLAQQVSEVVTAAPVTDERLRFLDEGFRTERQQRNALGQQIAGLSAIIREEVNETLTLRTTPLSSALQEIRVWRDDLLRTFGVEREQRVAQGQEFASVATAAGETIERLHLHDEALRVERGQREAVARQITDLAAFVRGDLSEQVTQRAAIMDSAVAGIRKGRDELLQELRTEREEREALSRKIADVAAAVRKNEEHAKGDPETIERLKRMEQSLRDEREHREALARQIADAATMPRRDAGEQFTQHSAVRDPAFDELREGRDELRMTMTKFDDSIRMFALSQSVRQQPPPVMSSFPAPSSGIPMFAAGIAVVTSILAIVVLVRSLPSAAVAVGPGVSAQAPAQVQAQVIAAAPLAVASVKAPEPVLQAAAVVPPAPPAATPPVAPAMVTAAPRSEVTAKDRSKREPKSKKAEESSGGGGDKVVKQGEAALRAGKTDDALAAFKAAIASNPQLGVAHRGMAMVLMMQGKEQDAKREYETYLQLAPTAPDAARIKQLISEM